MLDRTNPREFIGANFPPPPMEPAPPNFREGSDRSGPDPGSPRVGGGPVPTIPLDRPSPPQDDAISRARPIMDELGAFLDHTPAIVTENEARAAKAIKDRVDRALSAVDDERDAKVRPLNDDVKAINAAYHELHNTDRKRPGLWNTLVRELLARIGTFLKAEEARRLAAAKLAAEQAAAAEREADLAELRRRQAEAEARMGVCDTGVAAATADAAAALGRLRSASHTAARSQRDTKVRVGGGFGKSLSLRNVEVLEIADWRAAITQMSEPDGILPDNLAAAIVAAARSYRTEFGYLPDGINSTHQRAA